MAITKEDVKEAQGELGIRTSAKTKERVAQMHNDYAKQILAECGDNVQLKAIAMKYIPELPKASKGGDLQLYKASCEAKLEAFRSSARDLGLGNYLVLHEQASQDRHDASELAADLRQDGIQSITTQVGQAVIGDLGAKVDAGVADVKQTVKAEGAKTRRQVVNTGSTVIRRVNANTNAKVGEAVTNINAHTTAETNRGIAANAQNTSAIVGVDAEGYTVKNDDGDRVLHNGNVVAGNNSAVGQNLHNMRVLHGVDDDNQPFEDDQIHSTTDGTVVFTENTTLGRINSARDAVNNHTTAEVDRAIKANEDEHKKTRDEVKLNAQQNQVLQSKRAAIADMLGHEDRENFGVYRDSTVKWLGGAADRVMADSELSFEKKQEALDELVRMIDEESWISDGDKEDFENTYLKDTRPHRHI